MSPIFYTYVYANKRDKITTLHTPNKTYYLGKVSVSWLIFMLPRLDWAGTTNAWLALFSLFSNLSFLLSYSLAAPFFFSFFSFSFVSTAQTRTRLARRFALLRSAFQTLTDRQGGSGRQDGMGGTNNSSIPFAVLHPIPSPRLFYYTHYVLYRVLNSFLPAARGDQFLFFSSFAIPLNLGHSIVQNPLSSPVLSTHPPNSMTTPNRTPVIRPQYDAQSTQHLVLLLQNLEFFSKAMAKQNSSSASSQETQNIVSDIGEYLTQAAQTWAQMTDALVESRQVQDAVVDAHEQALSNNHLSDLSTVVSMDMDLSKLWYVPCH